MEILKNILVVIYVLNAFLVTILAMMQAKEDPGLEATVTSASDNNYVNKNKATTAEGKQKRLLITLAITFVILNIVLGIIYMI